MNTYNTYNELSTKFIKGNMTNYKITKNNYILKSNNVQL